MSLISKRPGLLSRILDKRVISAIVAVLFAAMATAASVTYEYDQVGRLRKAIYEDGTIIVYALDQAGNRTSVAAGIDNTPPTVPTNLAGTPSATPTVVLTWNPSTDAGVGLGGYRIYRNGTQVAQTIGTATTFTDTNATGLIGSTTYSYTVAAYDLATNVSAPSTAISVTTPTVSETIPPTTPGGLTVVPTSMTTTTLNWNASTDSGGSGLQGYKIYRAGVQIGTSATTSYNDSGLTSGSYYEYRVAAYDRAGNTSPQSAIAAITMPIAPPGAVAITSVNLQVREGFNPVVNVTVSRTGATYTPASVSCVAGAAVTPIYGTQPATPGTDFSTTPIALSWSAGQATPKTCAIPIVEDDIQEVGYIETPFGNVPTYLESFDVTLINPVGATLGANSTTVIIEDDDADPNDTTPPNAASGLVASNVTPTSVTLTWDPTRDTNGKIVPSYAAQRCLGSSCTTFTGFGGSTVPTLTDTLVSTGQVWRYRVYGIDGAGFAGGYSNIVTVTIPAGPDTTPPGVPGSFVATAQSSTAIRLTWSAASDNVGVTAYLIDRCTGVGCDSYLPLTTWTTGPLQFDDTGLSASTTYGYRIRARDAANNTGSPATASAATPAPPDTSKPTVPGSPAASALSAITVRLTWTASTDNVGVTGYMVERCSGSGCTTFAPVFATPINALTYDNTGLSGATLYRYQIKARDAAGNDSDPSAIVQATTMPSTPATITIPSGTNNTGNYTISWTANGGSTGVTYELQESKNDPLFGNPGIPYTTTATSYNISGKTDGTYSYRVRACNPTGCSSYATGTTSVSVLIPDINPPTPPPSPSAIAQSATTIRVTWQASTDDRGVASYRVERCTGLGCTTFVESTATAPNVLVVDDTGLSSSTMYRYQIKARDAWGNDSAPSSIVAATTYPDVPASVTMPGSPNTNGSYGVSWTAVIGTGVTYELQESKNDAAFGGTPILYSTSGTSQSISGKNDGTYYYRVRACNITGCSSYRTASTSVTVQIPDLSKPTAPGNATATGINSSVIRLTWTASTDNIGVTAYDVWRCTQSSCVARTVVATTGPNVFTADDAVLSGITVYYQIRARDAAGNESDPSATVSGTTYPPVPLSLTVPSGTSTTGAYDLSWTIASGSNITYEIQEAKNDPGFGSGLTNYTSNGTVFNVTGRTDGTYYYRIRACNVMGCSGYLNGSNSITVAIPAATQIFIDNITISGQQETGGLGFTYGLSAGGQVLINGTGALTISGLVHNWWLFPVSGMNQYQVNATTTCGTANPKTGNFDPATWQALGSTTVQWGVTLQFPNRSAQCSITLRVRAAANPGVILDTGSISIDLSTTP